MRISAEPLDPSALLVEVAAPGHGATALFVGTVRDRSEGKQGVSHLEYEVYPDEAERTMSAIAAEAAEKWGVGVVVVEHREGRVELGEPSVVVAVGAPHRAEAFAAAHYVIDELKARAPIWKKEHWPGGAEWVLGA